MLELHFQMFLYFTDKENTPKTVNDMKLINAGKILENNRTLAESRLPVCELPGMVITMHVVLRLPTLDKKSGNFAYLSILFYRSVTICFLEFCTRLQLWLSDSNFHVFFHRIGANYFHLRSWSYHLIIWNFLFHRKTAEWSTDEESMRVYHFVAASILDHRD